MDQNEKCDFWAEKGECDKNPSYMHKHCAKSCGTCPEVAPKVEQTDNDRYSDILQKSKTFGELQRAEGDKAQETIDRIESSITYMQSENVLGLPKDVRSACRNKHDLCTFWSVSMSMNELTHVLQKKNASLSPSSFRLLVNAKTMLHT